MSTFFSCLSKEHTPTNMEHSLVSNSTLKTYNDLEESLRVHYHYFEQSEVSFSGHSEVPKWAQVFSCEFCEIFKNTIFYTTPLVAASISLCCSVFTWLENILATFSSQKLISLFWCYFLPGFVINLVVSFFFLILKVRHLYSVFIFKSDFSQHCFQTCNTCNSKNQNFVTLDKGWECVRKPLKNY